MQTLEEVLRETAPAPDPRFEAEMEQRMRLGFPPPSVSRRARITRWGTSARPRLLAATAASLALATLVTVALLDTRPAGDRPIAALGTPADDMLPRGQEGTAARPSRTPEAGVGADARDRGESPGAAEPGAALSLTPSPQGESSGAAEPGAAFSLAPPPPGDEVAPSVRERRVERWAQLTLAGDPAEFDSVSDAVFRTTARHGGFVLRSSLTAGEDAAAGGQFELRIPAPRLQPALADLSRAATVRARSESATDVTAAFVSLRDRLQTSRAERRSLLRRLSRATTDADTESLRRRLGRVGRRIGSLRAQLRAARERTEYASVSVQLVDESAGAIAGPAEDALADAVGSLEDIAAFAIRALGILVPLALVAGLAWLAVLRSRRRARERALA